MGEVYCDAVEKLYAEKEKLLILGLTGRTGAGCSTAAKVLSREFENLDLEYKERAEFANADKYKFDIIKRYMGEKGRWIPFEVIEGSCVILSFVFEQLPDTGHPSGILIKYLSDMQRFQEGITFKIDNYENLIKELQGLDYIFEKIHKLPLPKETSSWETYGNKAIEEYYQLYIKELSTYKERIKSILLRYTCYEEKKSKIQDEQPTKYHLYTYLLQKLANNIRASGSPFCDSFLQDNYFVFAERIEILIELIIVHNKTIGREKTRICIDAIRNATESNYLKDHYRPYYLLSISVDEVTRVERLSKMNIDERTSLDNVEYSSKLEPQEVFYHQNISNCFEMADIHLLNDDEENKKYFFLTWQLVKYITLMIHPGLITPTSIERCMQLALNVKYNSGCLSRQVGAVVTGNDFAVKAVGWNDVPTGQLSCNLRNMENYCKGNRQECFSEYEYTDKDFGNAMNNVFEEVKRKNLAGRMFPYCFKDVYNGYKKEKNQVYTRALHAEENAFLQISKYGGQGLSGGYLFCTASPCELCAKKAYQLGITNIYYIDPYPGISQKHILSFGKNENEPKMRLFYGAIGEAYIALYKPLLAYKDELELVSGINCKKLAGGAEKKKTSTGDLRYHSVEFTIEFKSREKIESTRVVDMEIFKGSYEYLERQLTWTGSSYDKSELLENEEGYELIDSKDKISPYKYKILLNGEKGPGSRIKYTLHSSVKDETHLMHPYFAHMVKYPTEYLKLNVVIPKSAPIVDNVYYKRYADLEMRFEYMDEQEIKKCEENDKTIYSLEIVKPNLFYTYSIEWEFMNIKA